MTQVMLYLHANLSIAMVNIDDYRSLPANGKGTIANEIKVRLKRDMQLCTLAVINQRKSQGEVSQTINFSWNPLTPSPVPTTPSVPASGVGGSIGAPIEAVLGSAVSDEQVAGAMPIPPFLAGAGAVVTKAVQTATKAAATGRVIQFFKGAITVGSAIWIVDQIIGGEPTVSGDALGIPGIDIDLGELSRVTGISDLWTIGGSPEIPGEEPIKTWFTGSTYFTKTRIGNYYVLSKDGWKKYTPRGPIVLGTRNLTPRKLVRAVNKYYRLKKSLDLVFKVTKRKRKPAPLVKSK